MAPEDAGDIKDLELAAGVAFGEGGDGLEVRNDGLNIGGDFALDGGDHDVLAALLAAAALIEHAEGLADAGSVT